MKLPETHSILGRLVSAAGIAPAIPRSQAECVSCYATRCLPRRSYGAGAGETQDTNPGNSPAVSSLKKWRSRWDLHPHSSRRQRVAFLFSYRSHSNTERKMRRAEYGHLCALVLGPDSALHIPDSALKMVGGAGNAPVVTSDSYLRHRFYRPAAGTPPQRW